MTKEVADRVQQRVTGEQTGHPHQWYLHGWQRIALGEDYGIWLVETRPPYREVRLESEAHWDRVRAGDLPTPDSGGRYTA